MRPGCDFFGCSPLKTLVVLLLLFSGCHQVNPEAEPINRHATRLIYTHHARCRMDCRHITETEVEEILKNGEIDFKKSEPEAKPDPKYALEGYTKEGQHLRIIFASSARGLVVITCIELGVEWKCDCD